MSKKVTAFFFPDLAAPFDQKDIEFRVGATTRDKSQVLALPYITSRAVMDRLDNAVGPQNWRDEYREAPQGGVLCGVSIRIDGEWVTKWDGADNTKVEPVKGGLSDAFKRAAVKWGIGRYLYDIPAIWVKAKDKGGSVVIADKQEARRKLFPAKKSRNGGTFSRGGCIARIEELVQTAEMLGESITVSQRFLNTSDIGELAKFGKSLALKVEQLKAKAGDT